MARGQGSRDEWRRQAAAAARAQERDQRARERAVREAEKERKQLHQLRMTEQVDADNEQVEAGVQQLRSILESGLSRPARIDLRALRRTFKAPVFELGDLAQGSPQPIWDQFAPRSPGAISRLFGGEARYEDRRRWAEDAFQKALGEHAEQEGQRQRKISQLQRDHAARVDAEAKEVARHNRSVEALAGQLDERQKDAVEKYLRLVVKATPIPASFPRRLALTFNPRAEQVVLQVELPPKSVVPTVASYRYLPTKDEVRPTARSAKDAGSLYRQIISQVALLYIRDLFAGDPKLRTVAFNGHIQALNPGTGEKEFPCIISLNVEREDFPRDANLRKVEPAACVRHLNAIVSAHPYELEPIEPILDFDLSKFSFVEGLDAVSTLDARPDLMEMSPTNFEHLVREIFVAQGAEGWTTEQSNDDGVDAVIAKRTPLMGGLSIVQAKRWSKVVGISHVRELAGAMEEKRAGWGILVTTSWFTSKCWDKAREHGRMELIDGDRLVYLIKEHLGKDVLIGIKDRPAPRQKPPTAR
ncbi:restriction endonuclease [Kribbella sp. NBC_00482]|uniref:restriction endonuclease n=1 Tax=Kribbella sp. NBC_00482 TaxID=2975968 RepID=UPI002E177017